MVKATEHLVGTRDEEHSERKGSNWRRNFSERKQSVIDKLRRKTIRPLEAESLLQDIKELLQGTFRAGLADTLTVNKLMTPTYRQRIVEALRETPEAEQSAAMYVSITTSSKSQNIFFVVYHNSHHR